MTTILHGIRNCDTVKKARVWLEARALDYAFHDFKTEGVEEAMLRRWCAAQGWERVLNRAGTTFRKLPDDEKADLNEERALRLMLAQPSMIKRPVLEHEGQIHIGFKPEDYAALLG